MQITKECLRRIVRSEVRKLNEGASVWTPAVSGPEYKRWYNDAKAIVMSMDEPWEKACELLIRQLRDDLSQAGYEDDDGRFG